MAYVVSPTLLSFSFLQLLSFSCPSDKLYQDETYNAITGYYQNVRSFGNDEAKFKSIMDGTAKQRGQVAFDLCRDFAKNGADALTLN